MLFSAWDLGLNRELVWGFLLFSLFLYTLTARSGIVSAESNDRISFSSGVTLFSPINKTYASSYVTLNFSFALGWGIRYSLNYSLDGKYQGPMPYVIKNPKEMHVIYYATGLVQLPKLDDGLHSLTVFLEAPGLTAHKTSYADTVNFYIDTTAPKTTIYSPENRTYTKTDIPLSFTISEEAKITYFIDNNKTAIITQNTTLTELSIGKHNITINAIDNAGNIGNPLAVQFTITSLTPTPPLTAETTPTDPIMATSAILSASIGIGLIAILKKHKK